MRPYASGMKKILSHVGELNTCPGNTIFIFCKYHIKFCTMFELSQACCKPAGPGFVAINLLICMTQRFQRSLVLYFGIGTNIFIVKYKLDSLTTPVVSGCHVVSCPDRRIYPIGPRFWLGWRFRCLVCFISPC